MEQLSNYGNEQSKKSMLGDEIVLFTDIFDSLLVVKSSTGLANPDLTISKGFLPTSMALEGPKSAVFSLNDDLLERWRSDKNHKAYGSITSIYVDQIAGENYIVVSCSLEQAPYTKVRIGYISIHDFEWIREIIHHRNIGDTVTCTA